MTARERRGSLRLGENLSQKLGASLIGWAASVVRSGGVFEHSLGVFQADGSVLQQQREEYLRELESRVRRSLRDQVHGFPHRLWKPKPICRIAF